MITKMKLISYIKNEHLYFQPYGFKLQTWNKECKYINEQLVTYMTFTIGLMWCSLQENHTNLKTHKVSSIKRYLMQMITN